MKLDQEEIKKIVLGSILLGGVIMGYFMFLLGPLQDAQKATQGKIAAARPLIEANKLQLKKTAELEAKAPAAAVTLKQLSAMIPDGEPVAWFPTRVEEHFRRERIERVTTDASGSGVDKSMPGYQLLNWSVKIPKASFSSLAQALCDFENEQLLTEISGVRIEHLSNEPESIMATVSLTSIAKK